MLILGAHMSINKGFADAAREAGESYGANAMQIFTKSPRSSHAKPIDESDAQEFKKNCKKYGIKFVIAHSSYLLNLGKPFSQVPWAEKDLLLDFQRLHKLNGNGVVIHFGKAMDGDKQTAKQNIIENAKIIIDKTAETKRLYIIENTAGQGSEMGYELQDLAYIWKSLKGYGDRIKFCLDTSHLHGAGYDLSDPNLVKKLFKEFDESIGLKNLTCIHFNDAKVERGSRADRHDNLGEGKIGAEGLKEIAQIAEKNNIPLICETPEKHGKTRLDDLQYVRKIVAN
jgi:deoxyribonuclease IV